MRRIGSSGSRIMKSTGNYFKKYINGQRSAKDSCPFRCVKAMDTHTINKLQDRIMMILPSILIILLTSSIFFLPNRLARTPDGISTIILVIWKTVSARLISTKSYSLAARIATYAPVRDKFPKIEDRYKRDSCFLIWNIKNLLNVLFMIFPCETVKSGYGTAKQVAQKTWQKVLTRKLGVVIIKIPSKLGNKFYGG